MSGMFDIVYEEVISSHRYQARPGGRRRWQEFLVAPNLTAVLLSAIL